LPAAARGARRGHRPPAGEDQGRRAAGLRHQGRGELSFESVPGLVEVKEAHGETTVVVEPARLREACEHLRDEEGFNFLADIATADYLGWGSRGVAGYYGTARGRELYPLGAQGLATLPEPKPKRFAVSYHLLAIRKVARIRVQVWLDEDEPLESVVSVWPTADWHEREAWDMMGIPIEGHPNLRRILMEDDWEGHPLRKDYPIGGEPVRFSGEE
jgi:NADH/F420H2 dehydrogenase subunit C